MGYIGKGGLLSGRVVNSRKHGGGFGTGGVAWSDNLWRYEELGHEFQMKMDPGLVEVSLRFV